MISHESGNNTRRSTLLSSNISPFLATESKVAPIYSSTFVQTWHLLAQTLDQAWNGYEIDTPLIATGLQKEPHSSS
jgi:hypothetical protein